MSKKVFNVQGGLHSEAAYSALENAVYGGSVKAKTSDFLLSAGSGMQVSISRGNGLIDTGNDYAYRIQTDGAEVATVAAASASFNRIDTVVAYFDTAVTPTTSVVDNINDVLKFACVAGTAASTPAAPSGAAIQSAIGAGKPYFILGDILVLQNATNLSAATFTNRAKVALDEVNTGWRDARESWSYSSWDSATRIGVITVPTGATSKYSLGMRVKLTQATGGTKYGIVHKVTATTLTIFFKTGTTFNNQAISDPYYSSEYAPFDFDAKESNWTLEVIDTTARQSNTPTNATWYLPSGATSSLDIGIGEWDVDYNVGYRTYGTASSFVTGQVTLSTTTNSETDINWTCLESSDQTNAGIHTITTQMGKRGMLSLAAKTTYRILGYSNVQTTMGNTNGFATRARITARSAYI